MVKKILFPALFIIMQSQANLSAHCQMPCGIYHDDMVFDQIDQYVETMVKAVTVLNESKFDSAQDRNTFIRWIYEKETASDEIANLVTAYFLQQKIKPGEGITPKRLDSAHKMLFYLMKIKQTCDIHCVNDFYKEWERFKLMFHVSGYSCKMEQKKLKDLAQKRAEEEKKEVAEEQEEHEHDESQPHTH